MTSPSNAVLDAWTALMRAQARALSQIEEALKVAELPPLAWYDVLLELERAPDGLRPYQLEQRLLLPQYGLSRLLDRITRADLIARMPVKDDRRGYLVTLTEKGAATRQRMWPVYAAALQQTLGSNLTPDEAQMLARLLGKIANPDT